MKRSLRITALLTAVILLHYGLSYAQGPFTKFGRGLANTATGCLELPFTIAQSCENHDYIGGIFYGVPMGVFKALLRTSIGIYEVLTFPFPFPNDYGPIIKPEFVIESEAEKMRAE